MQVTGTCRGAQEAAQNGVGARQEGLPGSFWQLCLTVAEGIRQGSHAGVVSKQHKAQHLRSD